MQYAKFWADILKLTDLYFSHVIGRDDYVDQSRS